MASRGSDASRPDSLKAAPTASEADPRLKNRILPTVGISSGLQVPEGGTGHDDENFIVLVTRYFLAKEGNVQFDVQSWIDRRTDIFASYTLPSVINQSRRPDLWVLLVSEWCREHTLDLQQAVEASGSEFISVEGPGWRTPVRQKIEEVRRNEKSVKNLIISRLDNDDALAHDYFEAVQAYAHRMRPISSPVLLSFPYGLQMCSRARRLVVHMSPNGQFTSIVSPIEAPFLNVQDNHARIFDGDRLLKARVELLTTRRPMWIETVHGGNLLNEMYPYEEVGSESAQLATRFGFSL